MKGRVLLLAMAGVIAACGGGGSPGVDEFVDACLSSGNLDRAICECAGRKAVDELSPQAFAFLVASLSGDEETTAELRPQLSVPDATGAGMFMVSAPGRCAQELAR